jgi:pyruvate/2-oxoglutarate dehydrogenase complex dihydrolipoamide dehydrogenase (E3) component
VKVVCEKNSLKVLGIHYYGPHAGEVLQGFSVAMKMGLTK